MCTTCSWVLAIDPGLRAQMQLSTNLTTLTSEPPGCCAPFLSDQVDGLLRLQALFADEVAREDGARTPIALRMTQPGRAPPVPFEADVYGQEGGGWEGRTLWQWATTP